MRADINLPSFLFVGTAKAGTTSIAHYLEQHPRIRLPRKETFFFLREIYRNNNLPYPAQRGREQYVLDAEEYEQLYEGLEEYVTGEVGTGYLFHHKEAIPMIKEVLGEEVRILVVLRDPVERCYSSYRHFTKDLHEPFEFREAIEKEAERSASDWDFMWQHRSLGLYADQVKAYQDAFKKVKVMLYEDLKKDPDTFMNEVFHFLGVDPLHDLDTSKVHNPSGEPRLKLLQKFITHENILKGIIRPIYRKIFSPKKRQKMRNAMRVKNLSQGAEMDIEMRTELREFYAEDIRKLGELIGRDLKEWE